MKRTITNIIADLDGAKKIASWTGKNIFVVTLKSTNGGIYSSREMCRGDYEAVKNWCIEHQHDTGFDTDYVNQYFIDIAA